MTDARAFRGFRFPAEIILWAVRWYLQFPVSYRDLELMLADRGVEVDHTTMYRWVQRFAPELEKRQASSNHRGTQAASAVPASRSAFQAHGNKHASSCALVWPETVRSSTSVSQAKGSTPLSFAVATRLATIAQWRAPPSEPANRAFLRPKAITRPFCPYRAACCRPLSLARVGRSSRPDRAGRQPQDGPVRPCRGAARRRDGGARMDVRRVGLRRHVDRRAACIPGGTA